MYIDPNKIQSSISDEAMKDYKKYVLNILIDFDTFLKKNNINYSLDGGSLLGAIRHNGFIPWDDDIDIVLGKEEFRRLLSVVDNFNSDKYEVYKPLDDSPLTTPRMIKIFDKRTCIKEFADSHYSGAFIDVFSRIDVVDDNKKEKQSNKYRLMTTLLMDKNGRNQKGIYKTKSGRIVDFLSKLVGKTYLKKKIQEQYDLNCDGEYCFSTFGNNKYFKKSWMNELIEHEFEGYKFPIMKEYDAFLTALYGNYMELPPIEQRNPHHLEYLNLNESYIDKNKEMDGI